MPLIMLPTVMRAPTAAALALSAALTAVGCGGAPTRDAPSVEGIADTVSDFEDALSERDLTRVCDRILSPEARRRAGGEECPRRLARTTRALETPQIELVSVTLARDGAVARVRASSGEAPPAIDSMRFVPAEGGYRIDSLSSG